MSRAQSLTAQPGILTDQPCTCRPTWPGGYWDDWMRLGAVRKGRQCIRPEVCRTYNFGAVGSSKGQYFRAYLQHTALNEERIDWSTQDLGYLQPARCVLVLIAPDVLPVLPVIDCAFHLACQSQDTALHTALHTALNEERIDWATQGLGYLEPAWCVHRSSSHVLSRPALQAEQRGVLQAGSQPAGINSSCNASLRKPAPDHLAGPTLQLPGHLCCSLL